MASMALSGMQFLPELSLKCYLHLSRIVVKGHYLSMVNFQLQHMTCSRYPFASMGKELVQVVHLATSDQQAIISDEKAIA